MMDDEIINLDGRSERRIMRCCHQLDRLDRVVKSALDKKEYSDAKRAIGLRKELRVRMSYPAETIGRRMRDCRDARISK